MHDSGKRQEQKTGALSDPSHSMAAMELLSPYALWRLSEWFGKAKEKKYPSRNWEKGILFSICIGKLQRHLQQYVMGVHDEDDHLAAVGFWWHALSHYEAMIERGVLPINLDDMPRYEQQIKGGLLVEHPIDFGVDITHVIDADTYVRDDGIKVNLPDLLPKITAYLSHPIRGLKGKNATDEDMKTNCNKAIKIASELRKLFPCLDLYVPAEHDDFVLIAYRNNIITEKQILNIDCEIISQRGMLIVYDPDNNFSRGMDKEFNYAVKNRIPFIIFDNLNDPEQVKAIEIMVEYAKEQQEIL